MPWIANRRLWHTHDGKIVEDGDGRAWKLYVAEGQLVDGGEPKVEPPEGQKATKPAEDKAVKPTANKGKSK